MKDNVVAFSGGKDSTAMLHMMLSRHEPIHSVVFFDTGWEFPEMNSHIAAVERKTGISILRLQPEHSFDYWLLRRPVVARKGPKKGQVHRIGYGWPSLHRRWCTREKINLLIDKTITNNSGFFGRKTVHDLERRFQAEEALQAEGLSKYYDSREEKHDTSTA